MFDARVVFDATAVYDADAFTCAENCTHLGFYTNNTDMHSSNAGNCNKQCQEISTASHGEMPQTFESIVTKTQRLHERISEDAPWRSNMNTKKKSPDYP